MKPDTGNNRVLWRIACYGVILIPYFIFIAAINKYAVNIPCMDDYDAILDFLNQFKHAALPGKLFLLFHQLNEHRILESKLVFAVYYRLTGIINFRTIIFLGNLQLLLLFFIIVHFILRCVPGYWVVTSFVTAICLFDLNSWENADFAISGMQNFGIVFLCAACLYLYSLPGKWTPYLGLLVQILTTFSSGNGMVASAITVAFTLLNKDRKKIVLSAIGLFVFVPLYFVHYVPSAASGQVLSNVHGAAVYFLRFLGSTIYSGNNTAQSAAGAVVFIAFVFLFFFKLKDNLKPQALPLICMAVFLLATAGLVSLFRYNMPGGYYIPSRYLIYPHLLIALIFVLLLYSIKQKRTVIIVSTCFAVGVLIVYNMDTRYGKRDMAKLHDKLTATNYYYPDTVRAKQITDESCALGIYCIEKERRK